MTARRAAFRQCDVVRAIKAAKAAGAARVIVRLDGALEIEVGPTTPGEGDAVYHEGRLIRAEDYVL